MKKYLISALTLVVLQAAFSTAQGQTVRKGDAVETTSSGMVNWTSGEVYATGIGAPPSRPINAAQARAMTDRAAFVVALRNLLETVKGVRVDAQSIVENYMVKSDVVKTRVDGIVRGARIVKTKHLSDGSVEVTVAMPLRGALMDALVPESFGKAVVLPRSQLPSPVGEQPSNSVQPQHLSPEKPAIPLPEAKTEIPKPSPPSANTGTPENRPPKPAVQEPEKPSTSVPEEKTTEFQGGVATGVVIDGRGLGLRPALLPRILDSDGKEIYVGQVVTRTNAVEQGVAGYAKDVHAASNNFRVTDNPAVIKGLRAAGSSRTDVVVNRADGRLLRELADRGTFLQYCRVIIVY